MEEIVGKFLSLIDLKHLSENEEIKLDTENSKPTIVLCLKEHPYHDDALYIARFDFDDNVICFRKQHRIIFQEFIEKLYKANDDAYRLEQLYKQVISQHDIFNDIRTRTTKLIDRIKTPDIQVSDIKADFLTLLSHIEYKYVPPKKSEDETISYLTDKFIKAIIKRYTESWIVKEILRLPFDLFENYYTYCSKSLSKTLLKIVSNISGFAYGKQICEKAKKFIKPKYLYGAKVEFRMNSGSIHSAAISLENNPWRNGIIKGDMLLLKIKAEKESKYVYFKSSLKYLLNKADINYSANKSDIKSGLIKVELDVFMSLLVQDNSPLNIIINRAYMRAISFNEFGCCSKYAECEQQGKCLHIDQLYATACQWQKHLKRTGKIGNT